MAADFAGAAAGPATCEAVRRQDASRSFLGLQIQLGNMPTERIRDLAEKAWRQQAPKRLAAQHNRTKPASR